ncbi:MAG: hypothetical protein KBT36_09830 [Kurthia sp.]|nr:hypothetical protein [Candidatus Kurthia equi]
MIEVIRQEIEKQQIDAWFEQWQQLVPDIHAAHDRRDKSATHYMEKGITLYESFIARASGVAAFDTNEEYEVLPINAMERIAFIKRRPGQYACYRQLDELFTETKKRCARLRLKK